MNYPKYMKREDLNQVIKIVSQYEVFLVQVIGYNTGAFKHSREKISFPSPERYEDFIKDFEPATEGEYLSMLKDLFIAERDAREMFIKMYSL